MLLQINKPPAVIKLFLISGVIITVTFFAYNEALDNEFIDLDTSKFVILNHHIKSFSSDNLLWMLTEIHKDHWHPLTWLSHAIDYALFGLEPRGHHFVSILLHCFNAVWLFLFTLVLLDRSSNYWSWSDNRTFLAAGIAAILFGIHPQHVESVVWVAERKDLLSLFFIFPTLIAYTFYASSPSQKNATIWYLLAISCFFLAILSKSMAVTIPAILLILDIYPLKRIAFNEKNYAIIRKIIFEKIPFFLLSLLAIILTITGQDESGALDSSIGFYPRLLNGFNSIVIYLSKFLFPVKLLPYYPLPPIDSIQLSFKYISAIVGLLLITFLCGYGWYRKRYFWLVAWVIYLIALSPVLGIFAQAGAQASADRYSYFPTIPFYILAGIFFAVVYQQKYQLYKKIMATFILSVIVGSLLYLTEKQTLLWRNNLSLWSYCVLLEPNSFFPHQNLGIAYSKLGYHNKALPHLEYSVKLLKEDNIVSGRSLHNLAVGYISVGRLEDALNVYNFMLSHLNLMHVTDISFIANEMDDVYANIARLNFSLGFPEEAKIAGKKALKINPSHPQANKLMADLNSVKL